MNTLRIQGVTLFIVMPSDIGDRLLRELGLPSTDTGAVYTWDLVLFDSRIVTIMSRLSECEYPDEDSKLRSNILLAHLKDLRLVTYECHMKKQRIEWSHI